MKDKLVSRNLGCFGITPGAIDDCVPEVFAILKLVPVRVEFLYHSQRFEYIAVSEYFDPVPFGMEIPRYELLISRDKHGKISATVSRKTRVERTGEMRDQRIKMKGHEMGFESQCQICENLSFIDAWKPAMGKHRVQLCSAGLAQDDGKCAGFTGFTENKAMDRGVEFALISEAVLLILRLFMPALKDAAEKSENKIDDVLVRFLEMLVK